MGGTAAALGIEHVFVLMLENRSFDHRLGFSGINGIDAVTGQETGIDGLTGTEGNTYGGQQYTVSAGADYRMPTDPGHEFPDVVRQLCGLSSGTRPAALSADRWQRFRGFLCSQPWGRSRRNHEVLHSRSNCPC
jgi:hypothetical protein